MREEKVELKEKEQEQVNGGVPAPGCYSIGFSSMSCPLPSCPFSCCSTCLNNPNK